MALSIAHTGSGKSGNATNPFGTIVNTISATIGDIIVVCFTLESSNTSFTTLTSVSDGTANTYVLRNRIEYTSNATFGSGRNTLEIWWAYVANTLTNASISAVNSGGALDSSTYEAIDVTGFTGGSYSTNPWDQAAATAAGFAVTNTGGTQTQLISGANVSTTNANCLVFAFGGSGDNSATVPFNSSYATGAIAGTTATDSGLGCIAFTANVNAAFTAIEYRVLSSTISSATAAFASAATAGGWGIMPDALFSGAAGAGTLPWFAGYTELPPPNTLNVSY